ncbi:metal-dependent hydrolase family protein [Aquamicrobium terrae]|uniref:Imidazolonepropionase-like amidohydrolase n=1 Tax=Aquamicrobium terrae TaxID=1324945 RepID=A0ABV2N7E7_9HYPH
MVSKNTKYLKGARLIDGHGGAPVQDAAVVIEDDKIKSVGTAASLPATPDMQVIDAGNYSILPGLIDTHVHIAAFNPATFKNYRVSIFEVSPELQSYYTLFHAQLCFEMGFTTLRDLGRMTTRGQNTAAMVALRDAINNGVLTGPRLVVCGRASISNGHLDLTLPRAAYRDYMTDLVADGPWELRKLARQQLRHGVDCIKTAASGGGGTDKEEPDVRNMTQEELDAVVDESHAFHKHTAVHCFTSESHRMAVRAKVDTIEHIVFTDDDTIKMIRDAGIPVVPTLSHRTDHAIEVRRQHGTPEFILTKMKKIQPYTFESFQKMHQAGITLAMGTDLGVDPHMGENAGELEIYVKLGMTPLEAITTATKTAAEAIKLGRHIGTIEPGKLADIIVVDGDPSKDITVLQKKDNIKLVMKDGTAFVDKISKDKKYVIHSEQKQWKIVD